MDLTDLRSYFNKETLVMLLHAYQSYGLLPGLFITFAEAFIPPLPLFLLVVANAAAYGFWLGFLCSWIGAVSGAVAVFLLFRHAADTAFMKRLMNGVYMQKTLDWLKRGSFGYVFLFCCLPVGGPSALVNIAAGMIRMPLPTYLVALIAGKTIMILIVTLIGSDAASFIRSPLKLAILGSFIGTVWFAGKWIEAKLNHSN